MDASRDARRNGVADDASVSGTDPADAEATARVPGEHAPGERVPGEDRIRSRVLRLIWRTVVRAWDDSIFGMSAQAAFWMTLSLPPLLLGLLGSLGFVSRWFGTDTIGMVQREILQLATTIFNPAVVDQIIRPTVNDILTRGHTSIVSVSFVLSLWAGSSALASLVDSITAAYRQHAVRNPVWQRAFALLLYVLLLLGSVIVLPLVALGPGEIPDLSPVPVRATVTSLVVVLYYPVLVVLLVPALATLYKIVLPNKLPWHRGLPGALLAMVVFVISSSVLRFYIAWVTSTGYTYGALGTPIAFLLFSFFIAMAVVLGAEFNYVIEELWPSHATRRERRRWRRLEMERRTARDTAGQDRGPWQRSPAPDGAVPHATAAPEAPGAPAPQEPGAAAPQEPSVAAPQEPSVAAPEEPGAATEEPGAGAEEPPGAAEEPPSRPGAGAPASGRSARERGG